LVYHGPELIAGIVPERMDIEDVRIFPRHFQMGQRSMRERTVIVEDTENPNYRQYTKASRFMMGRHDIIRITKFLGWKFPALPRIGFLAGFLIVFMLGAYFGSRLIKSEKIKFFVMLGLFITFSASSLIITFNFSQSDYTINANRLAGKYTDFIQNANEILKENYGVEYSPRDFLNLIEQFNADMYGDPSDRFTLRMPDGVALERGATAEKVRSNAGFISFGWILGVLFGLLIIFKMSRNRGYERFLNTMHNFSTAYFFILPGILGMLFLVFVPIVFTVVLGFTSLPKYFTEINIGRNFVGFANFAEILGVFDLSNPHNFYYTLIFTLLFTIVAVILQVTLGILIAVMLNEKEIKIRSPYQIAFMLPWIIPTYISGLVWNYFFGGRGIIDQFLTVINESGYIIAGEGMAATTRVWNQGWFGDPVMGFFIISFVAAWYAFPFIMLVTLSALQTIPKSVYEAAEIDGANWFQKLTRITLPMIRGTVLPSVLLTTIWTFNNFNLVYLVTGGDDRLDILITRIYDFVEVPPEIATRLGWTYGYAAAYSALIFIILLGYILIFIKGTRLTEKSF